MSESPSATLPIRLQLLNGARLQLGRRTITRFPAGKSLQLLAFLALRPGIAHERVFLADLLWPDVPSNTGRARLSVALTFLRGLLEAGSTPDEMFAADRATLCLRPQRVHTDVGNFERTLHQAERETARPEATSASCLRLLGDALRVYSGAFLPGVTDEWIEVERVRLAACYDSALDTWSSLTRRVPPRPLSNRPRASDTPVPLQVPVSELIADGCCATLPLSITRFVGRDEAVQALRNLAKEKVRLVTLIGSGGIGKTRLALEAAYGETDRAVVWVPLADLIHPADLARTVANALRLPPRDRETGFEAVVHALNAVPSLVLLDNAEHLRGNVADFVAELLSVVTASTFWVTSREPLDIVGEHVFPVGPLTLPPEDAQDTANVEASFACALFVDRAQMVRPDFTVNVRNAITLARLCRRLDGIPLALELAAARVQTTSMGQILQSLQEGTQTLSALARRGLPARHCSLHAAIAWSVRLLPPHTARFLFAMSVFQGGWTMEAAEAVTGNALAAGHLANLVTASLVVAEEQANGALRYRLLETVHDFAASELDEKARVEACSRHCVYFTNLADQVFEGLWECGSSFWAVQAIPEEANLLAALETARSSDVQAYLRLAGASVRFLFRQHQAAITHLEQALALSPATDSLLRARALYTLYSCHAMHGDEAHVEALLREALAMVRRLNKPRVLARYLCADADNEHAQSEAAGLFHIHGTPGEQSQAMLGQAVGTWRRGEPDAAEALFAEAQRLSRAAGICVWPGLLNEWGYFLLWRGDLPRAEALLQNAVDAMQHFDGRFTEHARWILAAARVGLGHYAAARSDAETVIAGQRALPPSFSTVSPRRVAALACIAEGDWETAETYLRSAMSDLLSIDARFGPAHVGAARAELSLARGDKKGSFALAEEAFVLLHEEAGCPILPDAPFWKTISAVNARSTLARAESQNGLWDAAKRGFRDVLRFRHRVGLYNGALLEIEGLAALRAEAGEDENAARLFAACETLRLRAGTPPLPHQTREIAARVTSLRTDARGTAWHDGQNLSLPELVALALSK